jgi:hypothetical protein
MRDFLDLREPSVRAGNEFGSSLLPNLSARPSVVVYFCAAKIAGIRARAGRAGRQAGALRDGKYRQMTPAERQPEGKRRQDVATRNEPVAPVALTEIVPISSAFVRSRVVS